MEASIVRDRQADRASYLGELGLEICVNVGHAKGILNGYRYSTVRGKSCITIYLVAIFTLARNSYLMREYIPSI
jgi:hypothetical protein